MSGFSTTLEVALFYVVIGCILAVPVAFVATMLRARRRARRADAERVAE